MNERLSKLRQVSDAALAMLVIFFLAALFCIPALTGQPASADTPGIINLQIKSALPQISNENRSYSLDAASFAVFSDYECEHQVGTIVTDSNGKGSSMQLAAGRYYLRQIAASKGFVLSDALLQADIEIDRGASIETQVMPDYATADLLLFETNSETESRTSVAASQLDGAQFTLSYYDSASDAATLSGATRTWTFETDAAGEIHLGADYQTGGSSFFVNENGSPVLPLGRYVFTTIAPPSGYKLASQTLMTDVENTQGAFANPSAKYEPVNARMQVIRGDFMFRKVDENLTPMANIPFLLSYANGQADGETESHVIVTDANGDFSSDAARIPHTGQTNANDSAVTIAGDGSYIVDASMLDASCGIWFSMDHEKQTSSPSNMRGALPYGSYRLQELGCDANSGMNLVTTQFTVYKDGFTVALDNIVNTTPAISAAVFDSSDNDKLLHPRNNVSVNNAVSFQNLVAGSGYTLISSVICMETGEQLKDADGNPAVTETTFTPDEKDGVIKCTLKLDASKHAGCRIAIANELKSDSGMTTTDIAGSEENRTVEVEPVIYALANDAVDGDEYIMGKDAQVLERIEYEGLKTTSTYTANAVLVDKATGNSIRDNQGETIEVSRQFTPDATTGSVSLELPVDATAVEGHDIVVFTQISEGEDRLIANLQDIEDQAQTVKTVKLTTNASDKQDADKIFDGGSTKVCIVDTVKYANLIPGVQYKIAGVLMNKETGTALLVGDQEVTANASFVPDEITGSVDVEFEFDASAHTSDVLVTFETLTCDELVIAEHTDLDDVAQTVTREDIDPDSAMVTGTDATGANAAGTATGTAAGSTSMPKTGDAFSRIAVLSIIGFGAICICIAYAAHRRSSMMSSLRKRKD